MGEIHAELKLMYPKVETQERLLKREFRMGKRSLEDDQDMIDIELEDDSTTQVEDLTPWTDYVLSVETFDIIFVPDIVLTTVEEEST